MPSTIFGGTSTLLCRGVESMCDDVRNAECDFRDASEGRVGVLVGSGRADLRYGFCEIEVRGTVAGVLVVVVDDEGRLGVETFRPRLLVLEGGV